MAPLQTISDLYSLNRRRGLAVALVARREWRGMDPRGDWEAQWLKRLPRLSAVVAAAQFAAASSGASSVLDALEEAGFPEDPDALADPSGFAGWLERDDGSGALLGDALYAPLITARVADGDAARKLQAGQERLEFLTRVAVASAGSGASQAQTVATPRTHATFYDPPPYCPRCAVLVGKRVKPTTQFKRHPGCDGFVTAMHEDDPRAVGADLEQIKGLSKTQLRAIADGADANQVINAVQGVRGGKTPRSALIGDGRYTSAGAGRGKKYSPRMTPKGIYAEAGNDRQRAIELLREHGYILR